MTDQELVDTVVRGLRDQGQLSARLIDSTDGPRLQCFYRSPNGCKCAFGLLIPDALYSQEMETYSAEHVFFMVPELRAIFTKEQREIINYLQMAHDQSLDTSYGGSRDPQIAFERVLPRKLLRVADRFNLSDESVVEALFVYKGDA